MKYNKGQVILGTISIISLLSSVVVGTGFFYKSQYDQDKRIDQNMSTIEEVNDKLDILLKNFDLKYIPKGKGGTGNNFDY